MCIPFIVFILFYPLQYERMTEMTSPNENYREMLDFTHQLAWEAGKITLRYYGTAMTPERKSDDSPVTIADKETEVFLRTGLLERYPHHAVLGEEDGLTGDDNAEWKWLLDPIDGTKSFVRGSPLYGVMIGLLRDNEPVLGVVNIPVLGELVYAAQGTGCWCNGRPARVSSIASLDESLVVASTARNYGRYGKGAAFESILDKCHMFRTWGDCYGYVLVATGRAEVALDPILNPWDAAPLLPILREAGGTFTDWNGNPTVHGEEGVATNGHVFDELMGIIESG